MLAVKNLSFDSSVCYSDTMQFNSTYRCIIFLYFTLYDIEGFPDNHDLVQRKIDTPLSFFSAQL